MSSSVRLARNDEPAAYWRQRGIAVVEFAVSMGVLMLLMLAVVEITRAYYSYNALVKSVRAGSRYLATNALNDTSGLVDLTDQAIARARNVTVYGDVAGQGTASLPGLIPGDIAVSEARPDGEFRPYVRLIAAYDYVPLLGTFSSFGFGDSINLSFTMQADSTMRVVQ